MKLIISLIVGIAAFCGVFWVTGTFINWVVSGATDPNWRTALKVVLWLMGFFWTAFWGFLVGWIAGNITNIILEHNQEK